MLDTPLAGRGPYAAFLQVLDRVASGIVAADDVLAGAIRVLTQLCDAQAQRIAGLLAELQAGAATLPPSAGDVVQLVAQHMAAPNTSRLPVLVVAAVYRMLQDVLGTHLVDLRDHHAADSQTGALGDVQVHQQDGTWRVCYEVKARPVTQVGVSLARDKLVVAPQRPRQYAFVTTAPIDPGVVAHAATLYRSLSVECVVLDALGFLRHALHLFHDARVPFLDAYKAMLLAEPDSAVSQASKELWLNLRLLADADQEISP